MERLSLSFCVSTSSLLHFISFVYTLYGFRSLINLDCSTVCACEESGESVIAWLLGIVLALLINAWLLVPHGSVLCDANRGSLHNK